MSRPYSQPDAYEPGAFSGDEYFGDPEDRTRTTHIWRSGAWVDVGQMQPCCALNMKWGLDCPKHGQQPTQ